MKRKYKIVVFIIIFLIVLFTSFGYAAVNTKFSISGEAYVRVEDDIRITNLKLSSIKGYETYNSKYSKDSTSMFVTLPAGASATYEVEVTNKSSDDYFFKSVTGDNTNYELVNTNVYDVFSANSVKKFYVKITNNETITKDMALNLEFEFIKDENPTITLNDLPTWNTKGDDYVLKTSYTSISGGSAKCKSNLNPELENVTDLKDLTVTGEHNITCTVISNTGKTASVTKSTKITYDPYVVKNMIKNSGFESSRTGWTGSAGEISSTVYYSGKKSFYVNDTDTTTGVWINQSITFPAGHKMFASAYVKYIKGQYSGKLSFSDNGQNGITGEFSKSYKNTWHYNSFILTMTSSRNRFQVGNNIAHTGTFYVDDILVFDLTEIFGAGLEPDKKWCDKHIKYFDGEATIYK